MEFSKRVGPKKQDLWPRIDIGTREKIKKILLGIILENKVVQKLSLEKNVFTKKWSSKLIFLNEIFF